VTPFRFHRDPLFLTACAAYALNRLWLKPHLHNTFLHSHFNDLWLIPCALPLLLWMHRRLGWRDHRPPTLIEVTSHLLLWSVLFEMLGPLLVARSTADPLDIACYWVGGLLAWAWWNRADLRRGGTRASALLVRARGLG
jgi:hypothetical protein